MRREHLSHWRSLLRASGWGQLVLALCVMGGPVLADVLPDDRADVLYHRYEGGGMTIQGPSVLVRKKVGQSFSLTGSYYEDLISSASINVLLSGHPYKDDRRQWGTSVDYLHGNTTYTVGFIHSEQSDYQANTAYYSLTQSMFGDMTTVTLGYRRGWDDVLRNELDPTTGQIVNDPTFHQTADHRSYNFGLTQILTRNLLLELGYERITDQGYLQSPYIQIRFLDADGATALGPQTTPATRTSNAASALLKYFLPYRAVLTGSYRFYNDTWGITGQTGELGYTQPILHSWILDASARYYTQTHADFYSDLFPAPDYANFEARDPQLAAFHSVTVGGGLSYQFHVPGAPWINKSTVNLHYDRLMIHYGDFTNALSYTFEGVPPGGLYRFDANIFQAFVSVWF